IIELTTRAAHEQELVSNEDWQFIQWLGEIYGGRSLNGGHPLLIGGELLQWLARWGHSPRLERDGAAAPLAFYGEVAELTPHLERTDADLSFTHRLKLPGGRHCSLDQAHFFAGLPSLTLVGQVFYILRNPPPPALLNQWAKQAALPVKKLSHRLLTHLRSNASGDGADWNQLCIAH